MKKLLLPLLVLALWSLNSCQKTEEFPAGSNVEDLPLALKAPGQSFTPFVHCGCASPNTNADAGEPGILLPDETLPPETVVEDRVNCQPSILIPAGSVDALADALDNICTGGTIWLASGVHTENAGIVIGKRVNIKGKPGAVLKIQASPEYDFTHPLDVALHFKYATKAKLENVKIEPLSGTGGTAVLFQKSHGAVISKCDVQNFQFSTLVFESVGVEILNNKIVASGGWLTGELLEADGVIVISGQGAKVKGNDISQGVFGVFVSDREGVYENNYTHGNYIGLILCNVPKGWLTLPGGEPAYAKFPSTHWTVQKNKSKNNFTTGYLVIDGANKNKLINNEGGNNGTYDIELVGDSYRFGFFTPTCYKNAVWAGSYQNVTIKDCGEANLVYGGIQINTEEDPCY
jgi:parallel beta helix pectate lyase-like protein